MGESRGRFLCMKAIRDLVSLRFAFSRVYGACLLNRLTIKGLLGNLISGLWEVAEEEEELFYDFLHMNFIAPSWVLRDDSTGLYLACSNISTVQE